MLHSRVNKSQVSGAGPLLGVVFVQLLTREGHLTVPKTKL